MWLDKLKEIKKEKGMTCKNIAEIANLPEKTVSRIFSGETVNPYVDTLHRIATALGTSLDEIFTDTRTVVGDKKLAEVQEALAIATADVERLSVENATLTASLAAQRAEIDLLRKNLEHKDELLALHNFYRFRG